MSHRIVGFVLVCAVLAFCVTGAGPVNMERELIPGRHANKPAKAEPRRVADHRGSDLSGAKRALLVSAPADSFVLGSFSFDSGGIPDAQGWYSVDRTAQTEIFTHVADSTELNGGNFGTLLPIAGQQSLWCGTAGNTFNTCHYAAPPSYGNSWAQTFTSKPFAYTGGVHLEYLIRWDIEPGYDALEVRYKDENDEWQRIAVNGWYLYDGTSVGAIFESWDLSDSTLADSIQIQFLFTSNGAWSGEDGLWPTDGAYLLDSLMISDSLGVLTFQDFESEPVGALATNDGHWVAGEPDPFGDFAGLFPGVTVLQEDGCRFNSTALWGFFSGSSETYACGGHPEQAAVPKTPGDYLYMNNEIWSPLIDWDFDEGGAPVPASAAFAYLEFDVYRDLPQDNLVFYAWGIRSVFSGCPNGYWDSEHLVYFSTLPHPDWYKARFEVGHHVEAGADQVQLAIGTRDMCGLWCGYFGSGACHSQAPLIDNVRLVRVDLGGPTWTVNGFDLYQDDFPADGTKTGKVRMDSGVDTNDPSLGGVRPGDTLFVDVASPDGIAFHMSGVPPSGPAVYCHVRELSGAKSGAAISGDVSKYPVISASGGWTVLQFDTSMTVDSWGNPIVGGFEVDLNDNLYDPGDTVFYYFSARDGNGKTNYWTRAAGITDAAGAVATAMEVTCLPANNTDILYIDDADGHGAQLAFESAFTILGITPDRYDVLAPTSNVRNGPGRRVRNPAVQIRNCYKKIIWSSGNLVSGLVGDGDFGNPGLSNDFGMLLDFLDQGSNGPGVYFSGDGIASEWDASADDATTLRSTYMNFNLVNADHTAVGQPVSPFVIGRPGSCFDHGTVDTLVAFGGCPRRTFSVLQQTGSSSVEMRYSGVAGHVAVLSQVTVNSVGDTARVMLSGFGADAIHDDRVQNPTDRVDHLADVIRWLQNELPTPTGIQDQPLRINNLAQNYPNPFNPTTVINYSIASPGPVTVRVFNVAGQRVRTLVDAYQSPQVKPFVVRWDGTNQSGDAVSSGVYYYRLNTPNYTATRKMVLLK